MPSGQGTMLGMSLPPSAALVYDENPTRHTQHVLHIFWWLPQPPVILCPPDQYYECLHCLASHMCPAQHRAWNAQLGGWDWGCRVAWATEVRWGMLTFTQKLVANITLSPLTLLVNAKHIERWNGTPPTAKNWVTKEVRPTYVCDRSVLPHGERAAFYVGDFTMLAALLSPNAST